MKLHTNNFKNQIKLIGKEIDSKITFGDTVLGPEQLNAVTPSFQGSILKSVMRQLEIDSNVLIPTGTHLKYEFGVKVRNDDVDDYTENYDYINFGNYIVKETEKQEDTGSYKILCYDKMLLTMRAYTELNIGTFPMTVRDYINNLCAKCNINFKNQNDEFANFDKIIESDLYANLEYTYRDIFDELSAVTASTICINENDELEIRYINDTEDTVDEQYLKDINVNFGEKYGPINTVVLSRAGGSDKIYKSFPEDLADEQKVSIEIVDNQIMNWNDRSDYLPDILEKLNGLEYYINDFSSTGICYYDVCDRYNVKIGENTYSCIMFNDEVLITQGLEENIFTEMPEGTQTDYTKADKTDRRINQAYIIVDKQEQQINALTSQITTIEETAGNTYTKEQVNELIQNAETGITNTFTQSGGNNLLRNTAPWFMEDETTAEYWSGSLKQIIETDAVSGFAILTQNGTASQSVALPNGNYSVSFKYKKIIDGANCFVRYNGKTFELNDDQGQIHSSGEITTGQFVIEIVANSNNGFEIYDLILKNGVEGAENVILWNQNANESRSDTVNISKGITVSSTSTNTNATMSADGFKVRNRTTGQSVMEATATGGLFYDIKSTGKSDLSGLLIRKVDNKVKINGAKGV